MPENHTYMKPFSELQSIFMYFECSNIHFYLCSSQVTINSRELDMRTVIQSEGFAAVHKPLDLRSFKIDDISGILNRFADLHPELFSLVEMLSPDS